jgi:hypothetical protein
MKSPFPGMDPYIEACGLWEDFHDDLIAELKRALADAVPDKYVVRTGDRAYIELIEAEGKEHRQFKPDVSLLEPISPTPASAGGVAVAEPETDEEAVSLRAYIAEEFREKFVEIFEQDEEGLRLVTSIEILSPSNKRRDSPGRELYLRKRQAHLLGEANLVELDLLRGGVRMPMVDPWPQSPYTLLIGRRSRAPYCKVLKAYSLKPLPPLPIPLSSGDPDVTVSLQPMLDSIYARARYHRSIDYSKPCAPPLLAEETAFLQEQLRAQSQS